MNNTTIDMNVNTVSVDIPVRVEMTSVNNAEFKFTTSIDDLGQIILTPSTKDVEFTTVITQTNTTDETPIMEKETILTGDHEHTFAKKITSILINATMLVEDDNQDISAVVDEIGQVVIYPVAEKNTFITVSVDDSLNLITESAEVKIIEYCDGYMLLNPGNYWYVKDRSKRMIGQGFETIRDAKIFVCKNEIKTLESMTDEDDLLTENAVSSELPEHVDAFLQDIAQIYGTLNYADIIKHKFTLDEIRKLVKFRREFKQEAKYEGTPEADDRMEEIADIVGRMVKDNILTEETISPEVTADVIEEVLENSEETTPITEFTEAEIEQSIKDITNNFTEKSGTIKCDTPAEKLYCVQILTKHYNNIVVEHEDNFLLITYSNVERLHEKLSEETTIDIINKFIQGEIPLFSAEGEPQENLEHIVELDSNGYEYYYDDESDSIVSYPAR